MIYNQNFDKRIKLNWFHYDWFVIRFARAQWSVAQACPPGDGSEFLYDTAKHN